MRNDDWYPLNLGFFFKVMNSLLEQKGKHEEHDEE